MDNQPQITKNNKVKYHYLQLIYDQNVYSQYIKLKLIDIRQKKFSLLQLISILQKFKTITFAQRSYYTKKNQKQNNGNFKSLTKILKTQQQFLHFYSKIAFFILFLQQNKYPISPIPIFRTHIPLQHTMTKSQILLIVCMMAIFLIPVQNYHKNIQIQSRFSRQKDFSKIFSNQRYKSQCIVQYILQQISKFQHKFKQKQQKCDFKKEQQQKVTIQRIVIQKSIPQLLNLKIADFKDKEQKKEPYELAMKDKKMNKIKIVDDKKSIEQYYGDLKADFANKFIGGGALTQGCVQQEIMFANRPQLYVSSIICQIMQKNQSIIFIGFKKYFFNNGYANTSSYGGKQDINKIYCQFDDKNRAKQYITGIDAIHYRYSQNKFLDQFKKQLIERQLIKCYVGFSYANINEKMRVVSGNWGCGAFNGHHQLLDSKKLFKLLFQFTKLYLK